MLPLSSESGTGKAVKARCLLELPGKSLESLVSCSLFGSAAGLLNPTGW